VPQGLIVPELLVAPGPVVPELLVAPGPVVPVPEGASAPGAVVVVDGDPTTPALLPVRPEAPTPAPVPGDAPVLPPDVCAMAAADAPNNSAVARGRILIAIMQVSHICCFVMWVNGLPNQNVPPSAQCSNAVISRQECRIFLTANRR
jgi:hypothetical protein